MLCTRSALAALTLLSTLGSRSEAQVRERLLRPATTATPTTLTPLASEKMALRRFLAGPANLTATGTPAIAMLRWDTVPGAIGYNVSRSDPAGTTVRLTATAINMTTYQDQSGGIKPGSAYVYHVTAAYPDDGAGTAEVSFTPPAAAVPAWLHLDPQGSNYALVWATVPDAASYEIVEGWTQAIPVTTQQTVYSSDGKPTTVTTTRTDYETHTQTHVLAAPQSSMTVYTGGLHHWFAVGALYAPSGVSAPQAQWPSIVMP
jgi:hypothetical protein